MISQREEILHIRKMVYQYIAIAWQRNMIYLILQWYNCTTQGFPCDAIKKIQEK